VLVLDEPTTGLDSEAKSALLGPLRMLASGRTTIVVSHDPEVLEWADRVVWIQDGRVVADPERIGGAKNGNPLIEGGPDVGNGNALIEGGAEPENVNPLIEGGPEPENVNPLIEGGPDVGDEAKNGNPLIEGGPDVGDEAATGRGSSRVAP
jgi:energy-coupling factor transporter ATP-binding protein EcfA2